MAIDLGKYKSVDCLYTGDPDDTPFLTLVTDRDRFRTRFARHRPDAVVIEACLLAGWVHDLCVELGIPCHVSNTASDGRSRCFGDMLMSL